MYRSDPLYPDLDYLNIGVLSNAGKNLVNVAIGIVAIFMAALTIGVL